MPQSDRFLDTLFARSSALPILSLLEADIDGTLYHYVNDNQAITSDVSGTSEVYQQAAFELSLPDDTEEGTPTAKLDFDAGDITFVRLLRQASKRIKLTMWLVLADEPNTVEYGPAEYESVDFDVSETSVSVSLEAEPILDVQIPGLRYTPAIFPALWDNNRE